jgi:hypothetical protein
VVTARPTPRCIASSSPVRHDQQTKDYLARRIREGKSKKEAIRCLKR